MKKEELNKEECACCCEDACDCECSCDCECNCEEECNCEDCCCGDECDCNDTCDCGCECGCNDEENKESHEDKLNDAYNMISLLQDKLLREKAEGANYRKRKEEETAKMLKYSNEDIVKEILPIADNFERALSMSKNDDEFFKGFKMIYCNLISVLEKYEVKAIDGSNKPFDPTYHEAVLTEEKEGVEPGMIIEVMQKGYLLKDKVIRPAMVKVSI